MTQNASVPIEMFLKHSLSYVSSLINLFFPRCCIICNTPLMQGEEFICTSCNMNLPRTNYHLIQDNPVERLFWGRADLVRASSFFFYQRGSDFRKIIHQLKYAGKKEIGEVMGRYMAKEMLSSDFFKDIDIIIPVPLHPIRQRERGYNQSEWIAKGISSVTGLPIDTKKLKRIKHIETQTHKTSFERWENVQHIFKLESPDDLEGKHVLIIDDVLTTGATVAACISNFSTIKDIKISLLTLAIAVR